MCSEDSCPWNYIQATKIKLWRLPATVDQETREAVVCSIGSEGALSAPHACLGQILDEEKKRKQYTPKVKTKPQMLKAIEDAKNLPGSNPVQYF